MKFKHFILTRFNLGLYGQNPYKIQDKEDWMKHRINLFEKHCFKSICEQTNKNFKWIVAFDPDTNSEIIQKYDYCEHIIVCYEQPHMYLKKLQPEAEWLITSRFDNDDIYTIDFIDQIQRKFIEHPHIIDIKYKKTNFSKNVNDYRARPNSPFLSLVEPWDKDIVTALGHPHTNMPDYFSGYIIDRVLAYQVIHNRNISNKF